MSGMTYTYSVGHFQEKRKNLYGKNFLTQDTAKAVEQFFTLATENLKSPPLEVS